jgi:cell fate regulator YaaT (PSP1 superfamily)
MGSRYMRDREDIDREELEKDEFLEDEDIADLETDDEDIASLEDTEILGETVSIVAPVQGLELAPDMPLYRLRLCYSNETFLGFYPGEVLKPGSMALVPTKYGRDLAQVLGVLPKTGSRRSAEVTRIERPAEPADLEKAEANSKLEADAFDICKEKIEVHKLGMKLISVHYLLEEPKVVFFFTAETRVDFRELVKDLVGVFKIRIELRQVGVRDESRVLGGLGVCGRMYCCHSISDKLKPVSIKMAKDQNLSLNSMKISGPCGRLLCCLAYEHCFYSEQRRLAPPESGKVLYDGTVWKVLDLNMVTGKVKLIAEDGRELVAPLSSFERVDGKWRMHPR